MRPLAPMIGAVLSLASLAGCQGQTSTEPPIHPIRNMHDMPRYDVQSRSAYFPDERTMRPEVPHTVPREAGLVVVAEGGRRVTVDTAIDTGVEDDGSYVMTIPEPVIEHAGDMAALLERGQDRYGIYCVPCHGGLGDGEGMVPNTATTAGAIRPPTFHEARIREMPDGQLYATIRNGVRNMPSYGHNIPVADRWAIVGYVRALQLSQLDRRAAAAPQGGSR